MKPFQVILASLQELGCIGGFRAGCKVEAALMSDNASDGQIVAALSGSDRSLRQHHPHALQTSRSHRTGSQMSATARLLRQLTRIDVEKCAPAIGRRGDCRGQRGHMTRCCSTRHTQTWSVDPPAHLSETPEAHATLQSLRD